MTVENKFVQPSIPKFDGHYDRWSMLMENFLQSKEYWSLVKNGIPATVGGVELTEVLVFLRTASEPYRSSNKTGKYRDIVLREQIRSMLFSRI